MHAAPPSSLRPLRAAPVAPRPKRPSIAARAGRDPSTDLLPRRDPGSFPSPSLVSALERLSFELLEGAETGPPVAEGAVVAYDPLRDGPARYLGYSNECGEAFAAWLPPFGVPLSYAVAIGYVLVDTADKTIKAYAAANAELADGVVRPDVNVTTLAALLAAERCADTVVWQLLASVFVPGFTIHTVVGAVHAGLAPLEALPSVQAAVAAVAATVGTTQDAAMAVVDKSVPTALGLAAIPFIVHPIDNAIHALLNVTLRPALKGLVCGAVGKGKEAGLELCADCGPWKKPAEGGNKKH